MWTVTLVSVVITSCHSAKSDDDNLTDENQQDYYDENLPPGNCLSNDDMARHSTFLQTGSK